jgi:hypothetical protein
VGRATDAIAALGGSAFPAATYNTCPTMSKRIHKASRSLCETVLNRRKSALQVICVYGIPRFGSSHIKLTVLIGFRSNFVKSEPVAFLGDCSACYK